MAGTEFTFRNVLDLIVGKDCEDEDVIEELRLLARNCIQDIAAQCHDLPHFQIAEELDLAAGEQTVGLENISTARIRCLLVKFEQAADTPKGEETDSEAETVTVCCEIELADDEGFKERRCATEVFGKPTEFEVYGRDLYLYPTPEIDSEYTLCVYGYRDVVCDFEPNEDGTWNPVDLPPNYQAIFVKHVRGMYYGSKEDWGNAANWFNIASAEFENQKVLSEKGYRADSSATLKMGGSRECKDDCACCGHDPVIEFTDDPTCYSTAAAVRRGNAYSVRQQGSIVAKEVEKT